MELKKDELLEDIMISYNSTRPQGKKRYYSNAKLRVSGYLVIIDSVYYSTLEEAVEGLKVRITEAIKTFDL